MKIEYATYFLEIQRKKWFSYVMISSEVRPKSNFMFINLNEMNISSNTLVGL